jgi:hypothetical protein
VITSELLDRFTSNWRHFIQGMIAINSRYPMIFINVNMATGRHLDFVKIFIVTKV